VDQCAWRQSQRLRERCAGGGDDAGGGKPAGRSRPRAAASVGHRTAGAGDGGRRGCGAGAAAVPGNCRGGGKRHFLTLLPGVRLAMLASPLKSACRARLADQETQKRDTASWQEEKL